MIVIECSDCGIESARVGRGHRPEHRVRLRCTTANCPRRPEEVPVQDEEYQMALRHLRETRAA